MPSNALISLETSFSTGQIVLSFALSFALSFLAATVYRRVHTGPSSTYSFYVTLLVLPVVVCMIMMAIGSNIALSLGLVGALSIVRFRTAIKDARDMGYLFLGVAIGLCCGAGAYALAVLGTLAACVVIVGVHWAAASGIVEYDYMLIFRRGHHGDDAHEQALARLVRWRQLQSAADLGADAGCEFTYRIRLAPGISPQRLLDELRRISGLTATALIHPQSQVAI